MGEWMGDLLQWFAGGSAKYHDLYHCMRGDKLWIGITVVLDLAVAGGYIVIARHWLKNQKALRNPRASRALGRMKNIFIFCGLCGYIFIPIKMFWPAWRLYDFFLVVLVYFTWRYALDTRGLQVVYNELNLSDDLAADLKKAREDARRRNDFINAVSHDLRTPINGLVLQVEYATMALEEGDMPSARRALCNAQASAKNTAELLHAFLELAKLGWDKGGNHLADIRVGEVVRDVLGRFEIEACKKGLSLAHAGGDALVLRTDRLKFERILSNLLSNSIKFTSSGGVRVELSSHNSDILVEVIDSGIGISAEHLVHLFDEFYQVENAARNPAMGFGIGLAIARRLSIQLGADLRVQSTPGKGSKFSIAFHRAASVGSLTDSHPDQNGVGYEREGASA